MRLLRILVPLVVVSLIACGEEPRKKNNDDDDDGGSGGSVGNASGGSGGSDSGSGGSGSGGMSAGGAGPGSGGSGQMCLDAAECGPAGTAICDPKTQACGAVQCDADQQNCPGNDVCLGQVPGLNQFGACYTACTPNTPACGAGQTCLDVSGGTEEFGVCYASGSAQKGAACTGHDVATGCQADMRCLLDANQAGSCFDSCDYWGGTGSCPAAGEFCEYRGFCLTEQGLGGLGPIDPAPIGSPCAATDPKFCGVVGDKLNGLCIDAGNGGLDCLSICRTDGDCTGTDSCANIGLDNFGVCATL